MEQADTGSDDAPVVKMEVDPPLKMKGKGSQSTPIDLTSLDEDSDKENERIHPGPSWMRYNRNDPGHYRIDVPEGDLTSPALFIRYVFDGEETILEGCDGNKPPFTARHYTRAAQIHALTCATTS